MVKIGTNVRISRVFRVFRILEDGYDLCDQFGNCIKVSEPEIVTISKTINNKQMKAMRNAVLEVATELLEANNTITTLEIKNQLRKDYPYFYWDQSTVSNYMDQFYQEGLVTYTDNGVYRTYSLLKGTTTTGTVSVSTSPAPMTKTLTKSGSTLNKSSVKSFLQDNRDKFICATFRDGRVIDDVAIRLQKKSPAGYLTPKVHNVKSIKMKTGTYTLI